MELDPAVNLFSPLVLHHNHNPTIAIVLDLLDDTNYVEWSTVVLRGLSVKNKLQLIDGSIPKLVEVDDPAIFAAWTMANNLILMWIIISIKPEIKRTLQYFTIAKEVWDELSIKYTRSDLTRVHHPEKPLSGKDEQVSILICKLNFG
ncbi:hypothetical protein ACS0TY_028557 [Phlomoides rotata]